MAGALTVVGALTLLTVALGLGHLDDLYEGPDMHRIVELLGPYAKALVILLALAVAALAEAAGIDVGLDPEALWQALGAAVLVFLIPNRPRS